MLHPSVDAGEGQRQVKCVTLLARVTVPIFRTSVDFLIGAPGMVWSGTALLDRVFGTAAQAKFRWKDREQRTRSRTNQVADHS
jgi:hypothetical protein